MNLHQNLYKNLSKEIKSDNFCYRKVGRAIIKWGAIEKNTIFKGYQKLFGILVVPIIFSPIVLKEVSDLHIIQLSY